MYLIKSLKWSNNLSELWWRPNEKGYTKLIFEAGIYTEEDKKKKHYLISEGSVEFVEITEEIKDTAKTQILNKIKSKEEMLESMKARYEDNVKDLNEKIEFLNNILKTEIIKEEIYNG